MQISLLRFVPGIVYCPRQGSVSRKRRGDYIGCLEKLRLLAVAQRRTRPPFEILNKDGEQPLYFARCLKEPHSVPLTSVKDEFVRARSFLDWSMPGDHHARHSWKLSTQLFNKLKRIRNQRFVKNDLPSLKNREGYVCLLRTCQVLLFLCTQK